jgi:hypothetical protein
VPGTSGVDAVDVAITSATEVTTVNAFCVHPIEPERYNLSLFADRLLVAVDACVWAGWSADAMFGAELFGPVVAKAAERPITCADSTCCRLAAHAPSNLHAAVKAGLNQSLARKLASASETTGRRGRA